MGDQTNIIITDINKYLQTADPDEIAKIVNISINDLPIPTFNDDTGIYDIFNNIDSHLLSVLDGSDRYKPNDTGNLGNGYDISNGQIVKNNVICKRLGDVLVDKYKANRTRYLGGDPSYNTVATSGAPTPARSAEIVALAEALDSSGGIGIRLLRNDKWDNSFNTQGFSVHGDSSDNNTFRDCNGYTYFDFSFNFLIGPLENKNEVQSHMHSRFNKDGVDFIYHPTKQNIGKIEIIDDSVKYKTTSDERLKTKINNLTPQEGLELCLKLNPVRFNWKFDVHKQKDIGLIAQDVYEILEENYDKNIEKIQMIDYSFFNPIIISAVQCIQKRIEKLKYILNK